MAKESIANTFAQTLSRTNTKIREDRAKTIVTLTQMDYQELVAGKKRSIIAMETELDMMADMSTSNTTTTANRIEGISFDSKSFVAGRARIKLELLTAKEELVILNDDAKFYGL